MPKSVKCGPYHNAGKRITDMLQVSEIIGKTPDLKPDIERMREHINCLDSPAMSYSPNELDERSRAGSPCDMRDDTLLRKLLDSDLLGSRERLAFGDMERAGFALSPRQRAWAQTVAARVGIRGVNAVELPPAERAPVERARDPRNLSPERCKRIEREARETSAELQRLERDRARRVEQALRVAMPDPADRVRL